MNDSHLVSIKEVEEFIQAAASISFEGKSQKEKYAWIEQTLGKFRYFGLSKKEKSILKKYLMQITGYSDTQITRLIAQKKKTGKVAASSTQRHRFTKTYTSDDVARLMETDRAHSRLSGPATKKIFVRMYEVFQDARFVRLKNISVAHLYNLRGSRQYQSSTAFCQKTKPVQVAIGTRRKPTPEGQPGFIRVDTVHQGDLDKEKGVYHLNCVDEITQWEIGGCVEKISEAFLEPLLADLIAQFPFRVLGFHSDNGSEYINKIVAKLLNKLLIEQTKSRARRCNDNALVEGKNGSIIRKHMGHWHIPARYATAINEFYQKYLNPYLNYHRPCGFATLKVDARGKAKKVYDTYQTPFEAYKAILGAEKFLKEGVTIEKLENTALAVSDNEFAQSMQKAKVELFKTFNYKPQLPTVYTQLISGSYVD